MLSPKRTKFRKQHRGRMRGVASKGNTIAFGQFALQAQDCGWVTARQIEASRRAMTCLLYTSPSPRDKRQSRMPSSA